MSLDLFKRVINEVGATALAIKLSYLGEPLLNPNIVEMIRYAKTAATSARVSMFTNGSLMSHSLSREIVNSGLDEITFSIDAFSPEIFHRIRGHSESFPVFRNVEDFLLFKGKQRTPRAYVNCVLMDENASEIERLRQHWSDLGARVVTSPLQRWAGQFIDVDRLSSRVGTDRPSPRLACADPWYKCVVNWQGDVLLCCNDYLGSQKLGNLTGSTLAKVWRGAKATEVRSLHAAGQFRKNPLCSRCTDWSTEHEIRKTYLVDAKTTMKP